MSAVPVGTLILRPLVQLGEKSTDFRVQDLTLKLSGNLWEPGGFLCMSVQRRRSQEPWTTALFPGDHPALGCLFPWEFSHTLLRSFLGVFSPPLLPFLSSFGEEGG